MDISPVELYFVWPEKNSLQNRFLPHDLIRTEAVVILDEDIRVSSYDIGLGFRAWKEHPTRLVGWIFRNIAHKGYMNYKYQGDIFCNYNLILTGASIVHKYFLYVCTNSNSTVICYMTY